MLRTIRARFSHGVIEPLEKVEMPEGKEITIYEKENGNITVAMITSVPHTASSDYEVKDWRVANLLAPAWVSRATSKKSISSRQ